MLASELRGTYTTREFREMLVDAMNETGIKEIPSETTMHSIIKYLTFISPKMSISELRLAFEMMNTMQIDVYLDRPPVINIRLISQLVNEYARIRSQVQHHKRIYKAPQVSERIDNSDESWLDGLIIFIKNHNELPIGYMWQRCVKALIQKGMLSLPDYDNAIRQVQAELEKKDALSVNMDERKEIRRQLADRNLIELMASKKIIEDMFNSNRLNYECKQ